MSVRPLRMSITRFTSYVVLAAFVCIVGCAAPRPSPDPLAGWKVLHSRDYEKLDTITADTHAYIESLPEELRVGVGPIDYLEDGTGQHAVRIEIGHKGVDWGHVLIYDRNDKRIKVIKYVIGYYRS